MTELMVVKGTEAYESVGRLAVRVYERARQTIPELGDGKGNCWIVAAAAYAAAKALGVKAQINGGRVRDQNGFKFGGDYHYWIQFGDGTIIDSPAPEIVMIHRPDQTGTSYVPLRGMSKDLKALSDSMAEWAAQ